MKKLIFVHPLSYPTILENEYGRNLDTVSEVNLATLNMG